MLIQITINKKLFPEDEPKTTKREKNQFKYMATNAYALFIELKGEVGISPETVQLVFRLA
jgi:hypothetical protein